MTPTVLDRDELDTDAETDPVVEACLQDALGPYLQALSPEEVADYRRFITVFITTHPAAARLYERLRARPAVLSASGVVVREDAAADETAGTERGRATSGSSR